MLEGLRGTEVRFLKEIRVKLSLSAGLCFGNEEESHSRLNGGVPKVAVELSHFPHFSSINSPLRHYPHLLFQQLIAVLLYYITPTFLRL